LFDNLKRRIVLTDEVLVELGDEEKFTKLVDLLKSEDHWFDEQNMLNVKHKRRRVFDEISFDQKRRMRLIIFEYRDEKHLQLRGTYYWVGEEVQQDGEPYGEEPELIATRYFFVIDGYSMLDLLKKAESHLIDEIAQMT
jgi:hypothetical protein